MVASRDLPLVLGAGALAAAAVAGGGFEPSHRLWAVLALAVVAAWTALLWRGGLDLEELALAGVLAVGVLSAVVRPLDPLGAKEMLGGWAVAWVLWVGARRTGAWGRGAAVDVLAAAGLVLSAGIVLESFGAGTLRAGGGLLYNPNVALALILSAVAAVRPRWRLRLWAPAAVLAVTAVVLTGSRAGLLAVVAATVVLVRGRRARAAVAVAGLALATALIAARFAVRPDSLAWHRVEIWTAVVDLVVDRPILGVGPGGLAEAAGQVRVDHPERLAVYGRIIGAAESTPLGLLVRTGIAGAALALWAALAMARRARSLPAGVGRAVISPAAAAAVIALFHDMLGVEIVLWWWAVLAGSLHSGTEEGDAVPSIPAAVRFAGAVTFAWAVLWTLGQPALARLLWFGTPPSERLVERTTRAEPWLPDPYRWAVVRQLGADRWSWTNAAKAATAAERETRVYPGSFSAWGRRAAVCQRVVAELAPTSDAVACARRSLGRALELEPFQPWSWMQLAQLERELGRSNAARQAVKKAVAIEPRLVGGWLLLARLELELGHATEAREFLARAESLRIRWGPVAVSDYETRLVEAPQGQVGELRRALP